jgi:hypothetical protein
LLWNDVMHLVDKTSCIACSSWSRGTCIVLNLSLLVKHTNTVFLLYISSLPPSFQGLWSKIIALINNVTLQCLFGKQSVYTITTFCETFCYFRLEPWHLYFMYSSIKIHLSLASSGFYLLNSLLLTY